MTITPSRASVTLLALSALAIAAGAGGTPGSSTSQTLTSTSTLASLPSPAIAATSTDHPSPTGISKLEKSATTVLSRTPATDVASAPRAATGAARRYHVPVLMYHRIAPASERGRDLRDLVLDPRVFEAQLAALQAHGWRTVTSGQLARAVAANAEVPARTFVITLDDGREDGYTQAFPILQKHGFVATFFVITGRVNERRYLTWTELRDMQAAGMEIGNHTLSHLDETRYTRSRTDRQVLGAQDAIKQNLRAPAVSFAYPSGRTPANLVASVMASGLEVAYTTVRGADETVATAYYWPRLRVHPTTTAAGILWLVKPYAGRTSPESGRPRLDRHGVRTRSGDGLGEVDWWIVSADGGEPRRLGAMAVWWTGLPDGQRSLSTRPIRALDCPGGRGRASPDRTGYASPAW